MTIPIDPELKNVLDPRWNIAAGISYDSSMYKKWREDRPFLDRMRFMLGSYNAGVRTILSVPMFDAQGAIASAPPAGPTSFSASGATITADPASNALVIMAQEPVYNNLRAIIEKLDVRRAQVFVEALIVEVSADKAAELGIQWATEQCRELLAHGVPGLHLYTLNKSDATRRIFQTLSA